MRNRIRRPTAGLVALVVTRVCASALAGEPGTVAYIKDVFPKGSKISEVLRVVRNSQELTLTDDFSDLRAGDRLFVKQGAASILVLDSAQELTVTAGDGGPDQPGFVAPKPKLPRPSPGLLDFIKGLIGRSDRSEKILAGSRGDDACYNPLESNEPTPFSVPTLFADRPMLAAGKRHLFVSWRGGRAPFNVQLIVAGTNKIVANADVKRNCSVRLPVVDLTEGQYRLSITDANRSVLTEHHLMVGATPPAAPRQLSDASLSANARRIYFATWLASQDGGRWAFEAQQRVAELPCSVPAARQWLESWGGAPVCQASQ